MDYVIVAEKKGTSSLPVPIHEMSCVPFPRSPFPRSTCLRTNPEQNVCHHLNRH